MNPSEITIPIRFPVRLGKPKSNVNLFGPEVYATMHIRTQGVLAWAYLRTAGRFVALAVKNILGIE